MSYNLDSLFEHARKITLSVCDILKTNRPNLIYVIYESGWGVAAGDVSFKAADGYVDML